jgi:ribosomal protein L37AE/L43A
MKPKKCPACGGDANGIHRLEEGGWHCLNCGWDIQSVKEEETIEMAWYVCEFCGGSFDVETSLKITPKCPGCGKSSDVVLNGIVQVQR